MLRKISNQLLARASGALRAPAALSQLGLGADLGFQNYSFSTSGHSDENKAKIWAGNLPWRATIQEIKAHFAAYGASYVRVLRDKETWKSRGMAIITIDGDKADQAIADLNGKEFQGRALLVALPRPVIRPQADTANNGGGTAQPTAPAQSAPLPPSAATAEAPAPQPPPVTPRAQPPPPPSAQAQEVPAAPAAAPRPPQAPTPAPQPTMGQETQLQSPVAAPPGAAEPQPAAPAVPQAPAPTPEHAATTSTATPPSTAASGQQPKEQSP